MENKNLNEAQTSNSVKADVRRGFLLPFKGIIDLDRAYQKILAAHKLKNQELIEKLKANNIPYTEFEPCGVAIDMAKAPEGIKLKDLIGDNELLEKIYESVGVIKNLA